MTENYREKIEKAGFTAVSEDEILTSLRRQIEYARSRSSFYAEHLRNISLPEKLEDMASLPFTGPDCIRDHGKSMVCVSAGEVRRIVSLFSSGTSSSPKRVYFSEGDLQRTVDFFAEGMGWMCSPGEKVGILLPCEVPDGVGDLLARGLEKLGARPLRIGLVKNPSALADELMAQKPHVLVGMPWQLRLLSLALPELNPRTVLLSADYVPEAVYPFLEKQWGCRVLGHFGMTETCFGGAVECLLHRGMYLRRNELYAEIIDPHSGRLLPPGETGELVLTTLRREAMPLIRYRTGDYARLSADSIGIIEGVYGRIASPRSEYLLQEALCVYPELYDFSVSRGEDGVLRARLLAAPGISDKLLLEVQTVISKICGESRPPVLDVMRADAINSSLFNPGKRVSI